MTLDELLALLPDNTTGEIDAADLRTVTTETWTRGTPRSGRWSTVAPSNPPPTAPGQYGVQGGRTQVGLSFLDGNGTDFEGFLLAGPASVTLVDASDASNWITFDVSGAGMDFAPAAILNVTVADAAGDSGTDAAINAWGDVNVFFDVQPNGLGQIGPAGPAPSRAGIWQVWSGALTAAGQMSFMPDNSNANAATGLRVATHDLLGNDFTGLMDSDPAGAIVTAAFNGPTLNGIFAYQVNAVSVVGAYRQLDVVTMASGGSEVNAAFWAFVKIEFL